MKSSISNNLYLIILLLVLIYLNPISPFILNGKYRIESIAIDGSKMYLLDGKFINSEPKSIDTSEYGSLENQLKNNKINTVEIDSKGTVRIW